MRARMPRIPIRDTKPELHLRSALQRVGAREIRTHDAGLPGCPDIVIPAHRVAVQVQGCFWHNHQRSGCPHARLPKTEFPWEQKFLRTRTRDAAGRAQLLAMGWRVLWCWECAIIGRHALPVSTLEAELSDFLLNGAVSQEIEGVEHHVGSAHADRVTVRALR